MSSELGASAEQPLWKVITISCPHSTTDCYIGVVSNGKLFEIYILPENLGDWPNERDRYLRFRRQAVGRALSDPNVRHLCDWIVKPFMAIFQSYEVYRRIFMRLIGNVTLNEIVEAEKTEFTLYAIGQSLEAGPFESTAATRRMAPLFGATFKQIHWSPFPEVNTDQIVIPNSEMTKEHYSLPKKVLINGQATFIKYVWPCNKKQRMQEIENYIKVCSHVGDEKIQMPRIIGLVRNATSKVYGILYAWVESNRTLAGQGHPQLSIELQERWAEQVREVERVLNKAGLLMRTIETSKVIIDDKDNAWYVGLGEKI